MTPDARSPRGPVRGVPLPGDDGYRVFVAMAEGRGLLTRAERLELRVLHWMIRRSRLPTATEADTMADLAAFAKETGGRLEDGWGVG